jgi:hypothetical protein
MCCDPTCCMDAHEHAQLCFCLPAHIHDRCDVQDSDQPHNKTTVHYNSDVASCLSEQTRRSDLPAYVAGTFVWCVSTQHGFPSMERTTDQESTRAQFEWLVVPRTLHDYMGEPGQWPHVSSSFGAIDLAGFQKPAAWFYRSVGR